MFVQECEMSKSSLARFFSFFTQFVLTAANLPDLPDPGKQQDFGEAVPLPSFPTVTGGAVPASLQPPWPTSASGGATQPWFDWERGICQRQEHFVPQPGRVPPLFGHEESSEPVCFSQGCGRAGDALSVWHPLPV